MAVNKVKEIAVNTKEGSQRDTLRKLAATAMTSKLINRNSDFFTKSKVVVSMVSSLTQMLTGAMQWLLMRFSL